MNILILGGTRFVRRHIAEAALARGHRVTLFNRGLSDPNPGIDLEQLRGNRDGDLQALRGWLQGGWNADIFVQANRTIIGYALRNDPQGARRKLGAR